TQEALTRRLKTLELAVPKGEKESTWASKASGRTFTIETNDQKIASVSFDFRGDGCVMTVQDDRGKHDVAIGNGAWRKGTTTLNRPVAFNAADGQKVAAQGVWTAPDTYVATLSF